jgi:hypothetical protein
MRTHRILAGALAAIASFVAAAAAISSPAQASPGDHTAYVLRDEAQRILVQVDVDDYRFVPVVIGGRTFQHVVLPGESSLHAAGEPDLPVVSRSLVIPDDGVMSVRVVSVEVRDHELIDVAPSKGILYRDTDPARVPYVFGDVYGRDEFYPGDVAVLGKPYILRDHRGIVLQARPFQYNPARRTLRVLHRITIEVRKTAPGGENVLASRPSGTSLAFHEIERAHFLNHATRERYAPLSEQGEMLIVAHDAWLPNLQPLVAHKNMVGIPTSAVGVSTIGNTPQAIHAYLKDAYDAGNLAFVLLVGDANEVATPRSSSGASDPTYAKLAGNDHYPDVLVGRFSAQTAEDVDTQVQRTIEYEMMPATQQEWFRKALGIGSTEGPGDDGELDYEHIENIRTRLLSYGYTQVDQVYDPGAKAAQVAASLNEGRGIVDYCGHGSADSWVTSNFSSSDVADLDNAGMLPFIFSVACNNGEFDTGTCFAESWLRARKGSIPVGAIGMYASSISQSWDPPMAAQDESIALLTTEQYFTFGGLCFAGSSKMMDEYGSGGVEMFDTWHVFGDPSLRVFGTAAPPTGLRVTPFAGLSALGDPGGPFAPAEIVYTLENHHSSPISFQVSNGQPWITVDPAAGAIPPDGTASVTVSVNASADALDFGTYEDTVTFANVTNHDGDTSRRVKIKVGMPHKQYAWTMDADPGWRTTGAWAFGVPQGLGGTSWGNPDPTSGHTGMNVYGYNLAGDFTTLHSAMRLTTTAIDCSKLTEVSLRFWRWLNVKDASSDNAMIEASTDNFFWYPVWKNSGAVQDDQWVQHTVDLAKVADRRATLYLRWVIGPTDGTTPASGWNIDDVEIWGIKTCWDEDGDGDQAPICGGTDCRDDLAEVHVGALEICNDTLDNDCDGKVDKLDDDCNAGGTGGSAGAGSDGGSAGEAGAGGQGGDAGQGGTAGDGGSAGHAGSAETGGEAGSIVDAAADSSAGAPVDAGADASPPPAARADDDGCGCATPGSRRNDGFLLIASLAGLAALSRARGARRTIGRS